MRRTALLLASTALAVLLASGVALALNTINCDTSFCSGTKRPDLMKGSGGENSMFGRGGGDTLKGFGKIDDLQGQGGNDRILGGPGSDSLQPGLGDDTLNGGDGADRYFFLDSNWGNDTIADPTTNNLVSLQFLPGSTGPVTTRLTSDPALPEVTKSDGTSTINWDGDVVRDFVGSRNDDTVAGNDDSNYIGDGEFGDTDNITGAGGDDEIDVRDGAGDDTVSCGGGTDTVHFDQGDVLIVQGDCESQNPPRR